MGLADVVVEVLSSMGGKGSRGILSIYLHQKVVGDLLVDTHWPC